MLLSSKTVATEQIPPFISNEELTTLLQSLITPQHHTHIKDWLYYAKPNEKKGLYILSKIAKYKGEKIFKTQLSKTKEEQYDISKLTLDEAFKRYQQKKCQSSYTDFYGGAVDQKFKYNHILKYKDFQSLNYAEYIKKEYHAYIQNWIINEKTEQYKEFVLDFLRSFLATIRSNRKFITQYSEDYQNPRACDKFTTHATFIENKKVIPTHNPTIEEMQERLALEKQAIIEKEKASGIVYNDQIQNQEEIKKRKMELMNGNKNMLKGIYGDSVNSCYQEDYKGYPNKYPFKVTSDFSTSMVKGIIPDKYVMKQTKEQTEISDELKNNVRNMLFY